MLVRDHRVLQRYTYTAMLVGLVLLLLPAAAAASAPPINGARIWIRLAGFSFQPGEFAKIVPARLLRRLPGRQARRARAGQPPGRSASTCRAAATSARSSWPGLASLAVLVFERDLGTSLLFFGIFVVMLYIATERLALAAHRPGPVRCRRRSSAYSLVRPRPGSASTSGCDPFARQRRRRRLPAGAGLFGMGTGGLLGTGLGAGPPGPSCPYAKTDFIVAASARSSA